VSAGLYAAWLRYGMLLFRNVETIEQHLALSRCFGELELHPLAEVRAKEHPPLMEVGNEISRRYVYDGTELKVGTVPWHRDTPCTPNICKGATLRQQGR
jgi:taurine dioxygenase